jgi:predicted regulator of Ras-like GTPase activity (Roadblock/LC7/MglB family)
MVESGRAESAGDLERVIEDLRALSGDIESCAVVSEEGELLYSRHREGVDRERAAAMLAALANLAERTAREEGRSNASQVRVRTDLGHLLLVRLERGGVLAATAGPQARAGLTLYDMRNARREVEKAIGEGR